MKKVIIIGAGLTGLSAGITLQKKNIASEIYEMAPWAGGVCSAWQRKGYTFDGCIHWMVGTRKKEPMFKLYKSLYALDEHTSIFHPSSIDFEMDDKMYKIPMEINAFRQTLLDISFEDEKEINQFCKILKRVGKSKLLSGPPSNLNEAFIAITSGRYFLFYALKYLKIDVKTYFKSFRSDHLKQVMYHLMSKEMSSFALMMMLGARMFKNGGYPMGGARDMITKMTKAYEALGGKIHYQSKVDEIVIKDQKVKGIMTKNNFIEATHVIAACDMQDTLKRMLKNEHEHKVLNHMLEHAPLFQPLVLISLGLSDRFDISYGITHRLSQNIDTGGNHEVGRFHLRSFEFDQSFAPLNHSSLMVMVSADFSYWQNLRNQDIKAYNEKKHQLANQIIDILDDRYPGIKSCVEVIDVATPASYYRINNLYKASYEGFLPTPQSMGIKISQTIDTAKNLYLAGQWITPGGGIPPAMMQGLKTARKIIKEK